MSLCLLFEKLALGCSQVLVWDQPSCTNRPSVTFSILMFSLPSRLTRAQNNVPLIAKMTRGPAHSGNSRWPRSSLHLYIRQSAVQLRVWEHFQRVYVSEFFEVASLKGWAKSTPRKVHAQSVLGNPADPVLSFWCCFLGTVLVCIMRSHRNLNHMTQTHYGVAYVF